MGKYFNRENINVGIGIAGIILVIISSIISYKAIESNERIARESGVFDKARPTLFFANYIMSENHKENLDIYYGINFQDSSVNFAELPFIISNSGQKDLEDIKFVLEFYKITNLAFNDTSVVKYNSSLVNKVDRFYSENGDKEMVLYTVDKINPKLNIKIPEQIQIYKTLVEYTDLIPNKKIQVKYKIQFSASLLSKNNNTQHFNFNIGFYQAKSAEEMIDSVVKGIKRENNAVYSFMVIYPEALPLYKSNEETLLVNQYQVTNKSINYIYVKDASPNKQMIVAVYNGLNNLSQIRVYDEENKFFKLLK